MAKDSKPAAENAEAAPPKKKSKKLLVMIAAALVLIIVLGIGGVIIVKKMTASTTSEDGEVATETTKSDKKKDAKEAAPVYVALDVFTVNLVPEDGDQYLQLMVSVEAADLKVGDNIKTFTPKIRNNVMLLLSGKKASELVSKEGKETLANEIRDLINKVLDPAAKEGEGQVKEVLFTSFIIQ